MGSTVKLKSKSGLRNWLMPCLIFCAVFLASSARAQTWGEFFKQGKTQKKYLIEQIAALHIYGGYLKKGYDIAGQGINTVREFKNGEFGLHSAFFGSLEAVSPAIRNSTKIKEVIVFQLEISKSLNGLKSNEWLSNDDLSYIQDVKDKVIKECGNDLEELLLVITSGKVEMTDDERIKRLDKVYAAMRDKAAFAQSFCNQAGLLIRQKESAQRSINQQKRYYGINE